MTHGGVISAKLVAVGPDMDVANDADATGSDGWYDQIFTPAGTVEWTWNVTPRSPGDHELKLLMRPAVAVTYGYAPISSSTGQQAYITHVTVVASTLEQVGYWFDTQFPLIGKIGGILGAAALGILAWLALFSEKWGRLRKRSEKEIRRGEGGFGQPD